MDWKILNEKNLRADSHWNSRTDLALPPAFYFGFLVIVEEIQSRKAVIRVYIPGMTAQPFPKEVIPTWTPSTIIGPPLSP